MVENRLAIADKDKRCSPREEGAETAGRGVTKTELLAEEAATTETEAEAAAAGTESEPATLAASGAGRASTGSRRGRMKDKRILAAS